MTDLVIKGIKLDDGFLSWKEPSDAQTVVDLMKVEAIEMPRGAERPALKTGSGQYYPPLSYQEAVDIWSKASRHAPRKIGFGG